jgi:hypothetical protein
MAGAMMNGVLPVVMELASRHPERTVFTRFIPPERPDQMPGMWQHYYTRWRVATRECLDLQLLELMPPLTALCPPATVMDKTRYSARLSSICGSARRTRSSSPALKLTFACSQRFWMRSISAIASSWCATRCVAHLTKGNDMLMRLYQSRYTEQIETADAAAIFARWE